MFYSNGAYSLFKVDTPVISGGATPPSFQEIYSYQFDGVDDYIDCGDNDNLSFGNGATDLPFSISAWVKIGKTTAQGIVSKYGSTNSIREWIFYTTGGKLRLLFIDASNGANNFATGTTSLSINTWYHVACTYDGRGGSTAYNGMTLYINGVAESVTTSGGSYTAMSNTTQVVEIGKYQTSELLGNIDEVSVFNSELSASDITTIYNSGVPTSLSSYSSLVSWWRMGESANWDGSNWTLTDQGSGGNDATTQNMAEASRVLDVPPNAWTNTLSTSFDGIDDYVDCGDNDNLSFGDNVTDSPFTFSMWVKVDDLTTQHSLIEKGDFSTSNFREYLFYIGSDGAIYNNIYNNGQALQRRGRKTSIGLISSNTWYHIAWTYDGQGGTNASNGIKIYLDGVRVDNANNQKNSYVAMKNTIYPFKIGEFINGNIDEVSVFTSELSASDVTTIYNSGVPNNISGMSGLVSFWRMGDASVYPTINDEIGSNDGTMTNMSSANFVSDVPT